MRPADLCELRFPSGRGGEGQRRERALVGQAQLLTSPELVVYGTCRLAEQPTNPMLLEIVRAQGCTDLKYPLIGHLELRSAAALDNADGAEL